MKEKKKHHSKTSVKAKTKPENTTPKRTNTIFEDKNTANKRHCSTDNNVLVEAQFYNEIIIDEIETRELNTHVTFINGQYVKSIASTNTTNSYERKTATEILLELVSTMLPLNNSSNQYAWSENLYKKLSKAIDLKSFIYCFINDENIKKWSYENKFVLQRFLSNPDVRAEYNRILSTSPQKVKNLKPNQTNTSTEVLPKETSQKKDINSINFSMWHMNLLPQTNKFNLFTSQFPVLEPARINIDPVVDAASPIENENENLFSFFQNPKFGQNEISMNYFDDMDEFVSQPSHHYTEDFFQDVDAHLKENNLGLLDSDEEELDVYTFDSF